MEMQNSPPSFAARSPFPFCAVIAFGAALLSEPKVAAQLLPKSDAPPQEQPSSQPLSELDARLKFLKDQFKTAADLGAEITYREGFATLDKGYSGALERAMMVASQSGKLEEALALREEMQRLDKKLPIPGEAEEKTSGDKTPESLKTLRKTYRTASTRLETDRTTALQPLYDKYDQALAFLQADLTKAGKLDDAVHVKSVRDEIAPFRSVSTAGGAAPVPTSGFSSVISGAGVTNSLGMKFVPVPGTKVLMCIHETRRKDYEAFAAENPSIDGSWKNAVRDGMPVGGGPDDPVVNMSWGDAVAFCEWLGKKEKHTYRLPADSEWSAAVGIGSKEAKGATPESLEEKIKDMFPWGIGWPPPKGAGNYEDDSMRQRFPGNSGVPGYNDGFPTTSPVMSFTPNKLGLYDMGGNVWEWCEDWYNAKHIERVLRGAGWADYERGNLLSSRRIHLTPDARRFWVGFRCVVLSGS